MNNRKERKGAKAFHFYLINLCVLCVFIIMNNRKERKDHEGFYYFKISAVSASSAVY